MSISRTMSPWWRSWKSPATPRSWPAGAISSKQPGTAEIAFLVIDDYQGQGIGAALLRHLAILARDAGLKEFTAEVLPQNIPMLKTFEKSNLKMSTKRDAGVVHVALQLC